MGSEEKEKSALNAEDNIERMPMNEKWNTRQLASIRQNQDRSSQENVLIECKMSRSKMQPREKRSEWEKESQRPNPRAKRSEDERGEDECREIEARHSELNQGSTKMC